MSSVQKPCWLMIGDYTTLHILGVINDQWENYYSSGRGSEQPKSPEKGPKKERPMRMKRTWKDLQRGPRSTLMIEGLQGR